MSSRKTRNALVVSCLSMLLCVALLVATTFAWFTDIATSSSNRIVAGNLDVDLIMADSYNGTYSSIAGGTGDIFKAGANANSSNATLWEPGATHVAYLGVQNKGSLALKYNIYLDVTDNGLASALEYAIVPFGSAVPTAAIASWSAAKSATGAATGNVAAGRSIAAQGGCLDEIAKGTANEANYFALVVHMKEDAGNEYQGKDIVIDVSVVATQKDAESDSFDNTYDATSTYPALAPFINLSASETVTTLGATVTIADANSIATTVIPAAENGVQIVTSAKTTDATAIKSEYQMAADSTLSRTIKTTNTSENSATYDISFVYTEKVNDVTTSYNVSEFKSVLTNEIELSAGLKNVKVTHSHGGVATDMKKATTAADEGKDGYYKYDAATGKLTIWSKAYSEFAVSYDSDFDVVVSGKGMSLADFRNSVNKGESYAGKTVTLLKDVDLSGTEWTPIGTETHPFDGSFDGNNKTISGLQITQANSEGTGFFGYINNANTAITFKNLTLKDANVNLGASAGKNVGTFIGYVLKTSKDITIENVNVTGISTVTGKAHTGGIIGKIYGTNAVIKNCENNATVTCAGMYVGGIVAITSDNAQTITYMNLTNNGALSGSNSGGIVGRTGSKNVYFVNCQNTATVTGTSVSGGIVGTAEGTLNLNIDADTVNTGAITGATKGSLIGYTYAYTSLENNVSIMRSGTDEYCDTEELGLIGEFGVSKISIQNAKLHRLDFTTSWKNVVRVNLTDCKVDSINWVTSSGENSGGHASDGEYFYLNGNNNSTVNTLKYTQQYAHYKNYYSFKNIENIAIVNGNMAPLDSVAWAD